MSKKSFNDIEQIIKNAAQAHDPAFDEESWKKMETLLDKDKDRKRPLAFWLMWLLPFLMGAGVLSYFAFDENADQKANTVLEYNNPVKESIPPKEIKNVNIAELSTNTEVPEESGSISINNSSPVKTYDNRTQEQFAATMKEPSQITNDKKLFKEDEENLFSKNNTTDVVRGKLKTKIKAARPVSDEVDEEIRYETSMPESVLKNDYISIQKEGVIIVKVDADKVDEKEIEKIIDSVVAKKANDKKSKNKQYGFYIIAAGGMEASGVKLFSSDKITGRAGLAVGYQINKKLSVQTGFFVSNKKYVASGSDYKTKPGSYWSTVDIKSIAANCKVYEIPVTVRYDFSTGKKLNIFASAGLSSYIMKKEDYQIYYDRYGTAHEAETYYSGNKSFFSVLRLSAGAEKKISKNVSVFASPGIAIPLAGVGEGEVKLFSTDIILGLKITPFKK